MEFKGLKLSNWVICDDELSQIKGGATVSNISPDLLDLEEDRKKGKGKKAPVPQKPTPKDGGGWGDNNGENY